MKPRSLCLYVLIAMLTGIFLYGTVRLLRLRYEAGDVYPPYSSLRSDPLGTKALFAGIDNLDGFSCSRNYRPFTELKKVGDTTIFYQGLSARQFLHSADKEAVEKIVAQGGRFFISFLPVSREGQLTGTWSFDVTENDVADEAADGEEQTEEERKEERGEASLQEDGENLEESFSLIERWGLEFNVSEEKSNRDSAKRSARVSSSQITSLPESLSWHTALYFSLQDEDWRVIYRQGSYPVFIERSFGKGSIVISADSYFLSNEALQNERHSELLAWLVGTNPKVMFDETHFGVMQSQGVATLIWKYHLEGFFIALFMLALLFVWKNVTSLVPKREETTLETKIAGKDMMAGLVNLLRRNISSRELLPVCFKEWGKSFAHLRKSDPETFKKLQEVIQAEEKRSVRERDPVKTYRQFYHILTKSPRATGWRLKQK